MPTGVDATQMMPLSCTTSEFTNQTAVVISPLSVMAGRVQMENEKSYQDEPLSSATALTIYGRTPLSCAADPGDEWATFSLGTGGSFARSNAELTFTRDALEKFITKATEALHILDLPDPEDEPAPPPPPK